AGRRVLESGADYRRQALPGSRHLERLQARQQVPEDRLELDPRDVCAHAEVLAEPEREMGIRATIHSERERVVEDFLVAVGGREVQRQLVPGVDRLPTND